MRHPRFTPGVCAWPGCKNPAFVLCVRHTGIPLPPRVPQSGPVEILDTHGRILIPSVRLDKEPRAQVPGSTRITDGDQGHHDPAGQPDRSAGHHDAPRSSQEWRA